VPSPHVVHSPQSPGQELQVSSASQLPFPQESHTPQSCGQELHVSPAPQLPFPQVSPPSLPVISAWVSNPDFAPQPGAARTKTASRSPAAKSQRLRMPGV
jgi:hypothetical protein